MARLADEAGDCGANDLLVGDIVRANEPQVFAAEHLVDGPTVTADSDDAN